MKEKREEENNGKIECAKAKEVGKRIQELRKDKKETQADLGEALGLTQNNISKIENGTVNLTLSNLLNIAEHYNTTIDYLCYGIKQDTILETLKKYITLSYKASNIGEEKFFYPQIEMHVALFNYLFRIAEITYRIAGMADITKKLKEDWERQMSELFYKENQENPSLKCKFIPCPHKMIFPDVQKEHWKQSDLLREIHNYFANFSFSSEENN